MLLDTNAISAWAASEAGIFRILKGDRPWYLPSIALGEFRYGLLGSTQRFRLEAWLESIEAACEVLGPEGETARIYGQLRREVERQHFVVPYHDIWIAALALQHSLDVVTRDAHFDHIPGIRRVGW